jgi:hypothetical protein
MYRKTFSTLTHFVHGYGRIGSPNFSGIFFQGAPKKKLLDFSHLVIYMANPPLHGYVHQIEKFEKITI